MSAKRAEKRRQESCGGVTERRSRSPLKESRKGSRKRVLCSPRICLRRIGEGLFDIETTKMGEMAEMEYTMMRGIQSAFSSTILMRARYDHYGRFPRQCQLLSE